MKLNKAILYKDSKNVKLIWILMFFSMLFYNFYSFNDNFIPIISSANKQPWFNNALFISDSQVLVFVLSLVLSCVLFIHEKSNYSYSFVFSMPFTREELLINKWFLGIFVIFSACMLNMVITFLFYFSKLNFINTIINPASNVTKFFVLCFFIASLLFTVGIFFQTIMGNVILSGIVATIALALPQFITFIIRTNLINYCKTLNTRTIYFINSLNSILSPYLYFEPKDIYINNLQSSILYLNNFYLNIFLCIVLTFIFLMLSIYCFNKKDLEKNNRIAITNKLELIFKICVSICVSLAFTTFLEIAQYSFVLFFIAFVFLFFIAYILLNKLIKNFM